MDSGKFVAVILAAGLVGIVIGAALVEGVHPSAVRVTYPTTVTVPSITTVTSFINSTETVYPTNSELVLQCTATSYFQGDIEEVFGTSVAVTSENSTYTTFSITSTSTPGISTGGSTTYTSTTNATETPGFVMTSTSINQACAPSSCWTVTTCTYLP